jgi:hypothetical protein
MASEHQPDETRIEHSDINARSVLLTGVFGIIGVWIIIGILYFCFTYIVHQGAAAMPLPVPTEAQVNPMPPYPRLQSAPARDLKTLRAREDWELSHYYWVDKSKGTVAIPIERAIEILSQRGIPPQKQPSNLTLSQPQAGTRQTGFEGKVEPEPR